MPRGQPQREVPARGVAHDRDPAGVHAVQVRHRVQPRRDVVEGRGPPRRPRRPGGTPGSRRRTARGEVRRQPVHQVAPPARAPVPAVQQHRHRPRRGAVRHPQVPDLVLTVAVGDHRRPGALAVAQGAADLALGVALRQGVALVVRRLAGAQPDLELGVAVAPVQAHGHDGPPALLGEALHRLDLAAVQEQLARPGRVVVRAVAERVLRDGGLHEERLAVADHAVGLRQRRLAAAQRLHLGAGQHQPGLERVGDLVVEPGAPVDRDGVLALLLRHAVPYRPPAVASWSASTSPRRGELRSSGSSGPIDVPSTEATSVSGRTPTPSIEVPSGV